MADGGHPQRRLCILANGLCHSLGRAAAAASPPQSKPWQPEGHARPPVVLSEQQRLHYEQHGYLVLPPGLISASHLAKLQQETERQAVLSCVPEQHERFVYEEAHTDHDPRLIRLLAPEIVKIFWEFMTGPAADLAVDLLGPDIK